MLTKTAIRHPAFIAALKTAAAEAMAAASGNAPGWAFVRNRKGRVSATVVWHPGPQMVEVFDRTDADITDTVLTALHVDSVRQQMIVALSKCRAMLALCKTMKTESGRRAAHNLAKMHLRRFALMRESI